MVPKEGPSNVWRYQAYISYGLLILYLVLSFVIPDSKLVSYIFIGIHSIFVALGIVGYIWIQMAIQIAKIANLFRPEMSAQNLSDVALLNKSAIPRFALGIAYWLLPIGAYAYYLYDLKILYVFVFLPILYPLFYAVSIRKIRDFERRIGSPIVKHHHLDNSG